MMEQRGKSAEAAGNMRCVLIKKVEKNTLATDEMLHNQTLCYIIKPCHGNKCIIMPCIEQIHEG